MGTLPDTGVEQVMWPDHCVQGSEGAKFHPLCQPRDTDIIVDKGTDVRVDSYSGFGSTAEDGAKNGFTTYLITDATKSVNPATAESMSKRLQAAGVVEITSDQILNV